MNTLFPILGVVFGLLLVGGVAAYGVSLYNRLVRVDERVENAWSDVDVVLKQRGDMLAKLVDTVRRAMDYERATLTDLVEAREAAARARTPGEHAAADAKVREALSGLNVAVRAEAYPELEAVDNLAHLQDRIAAIEESIADRREVYNESVTTYNTLIRQVPYVLLAGPMNYERRELFEAPAADLADVDVDELFGDDPVPERA